MRTIVSRSMARLLAILCVGLGVSICTLGDEGRKESLQISSDNPTVRKIFRASPQDVLDMRGATEARRDAMYRELSEPLEPLDERVSLRLIPEEQSPTVYLHYLSPTVIQVFDGTGEPWPIEDIALVHPELVSGRVVENQFGNSLVLYNLRPQGSTHLTMFLAGQPLPINIVIRAVPDKYHRNMRISVQELGPQARLDMDTAVSVRSLGLPPDADLQSALAGVMPYGSEQLKASREDVMAWRKEGNIILRTRLHVFSPDIIRMEAGQNGYKAYRLVDTTRVNASNDSGAVVNIRLEAN